MIYLTPGPWRASTYYSENGRRGFQVFGGPDGQNHVADLGYWNRQAQADAKLIAAAPALYAALSMLSQCPDSIAAQTKAREALAQVRGEEL